MTSVSIGRDQLIVTEVYVEAVRLVMLDKDETEEPKRLGFSVFTLLT